MKRYLLFAWWAYSARGGWDDLKGQFDNLEELHEKILYYSHEKEGYKVRLLDPSKSKEVEEYYYGCLQIIDTLEDKDISDSVIRCYKPA